MLNIGFKSMSQHALAGVLLIMAPAIFLATLVGDFYLTILAVILFSVIGSVAYSVFLGINVFRIQRTQIGLLNYRLSLFKQEENHE